MSISSVGYNPSYFSKSLVNRTDISTKVSAGSALANITGKNSTIGSSTKIEVSTPTVDRKDVFGTDGTGVHSEIKMNGKVVGQIFNSGAVSVLNEYAHLSEKMLWGGPLEEGISGPDLVQKRTADLMNAFKGEGLSINRTDTAMTQAEWVKWLMSPEGAPGARLNKTA